MPKSPHLLLAGSNCKRLRSNLIALLDASSLGSIDNEIINNVIGLYTLGREHYTFAVGLQKPEWRQKISRLYYAAYNIARSIWFSYDGHYSTESTDHKKVVNLPDDFPNKSKYSNQLGVLRDDRNLCDYDHTAVISDLIISPEDAGALLSDLCNDTVAYFSAKGIRV